ncbi:MAG TPA: heparinase II/III family protein [Candidatus Hydrogenedentes bacterium]|mgnify:CR=1 FL=1|nr:heparinase II/III family protein [Candidatus Hydrogenedentota bacterium]
MKPQTFIHCFLLASLILGFSLNTALAQEKNPSRPTTFPIPLNVAEAILDPFWSTEISTFPQWTVDSGKDHGLIIKQNWSAVDYEWESAPKKGPALRLHRTFQVDCSRYDRLMVKAAIPAQARLHIIAETEKGKRELTSGEGAGKEYEYFLDLDTATRLLGITLEIERESPGQASGWFRWTGLQNSARLKDYFAQWDFSGMDWTPYLKPATFTPEFKPRYGIFLNESELETLRADQAKAEEQHQETRYTQLAQEAKTMNFEKGISEFVRSGGEVTIHGRLRNADQAALPGNPELAVAALVLKNPDLLRSVARWALSTAACGQWEMGFMSCMPANPWEDRPFKHSYVSEDLARVLDLAGEIFSEAGRLYLMRRISEEGIGTINYTTWRHEYIFHCNQLAYFNFGRMCAYLVLEREWPRVKPYTELALADSIDSLNTVILPDGGYVEGPSYFGAAVRHNLEVLEQYARAREKDAASLIPDAVRRTENFGTLVASTTSADVIPICDSSPELSTSLLKQLSTLMPGSIYERMLGKKQAIKANTPWPDLNLPDLVKMPDMGPAASVRKAPGGWVKLLIMGNSAGADHTHEDKGSFVLEYAGETFAEDLGICDYEDPIHQQYKICQRHNMLAPIGTPERAHPLRPLPMDIIPTVEGDATSFHARVDVTPGWGPYYKKWIRSWDSPSPEKLTIRDEYELTSGTGVEFYWQTQLPVQIEDKKIILTGAKGRVIIEIPKKCTARVEELPLFKGNKQHRITIQKKGTSGILETKLALETL